MMEQTGIFVLLYTIIIFIGHFFQKTFIPIPIVLVIAGMFLSFIPHFPIIHLNSELVLNIFLPILIYEISIFSSWKDIKRNLRPIALLSIGHVIFIAVLVAIVLHFLIPELGWALAFVLGAIISPPDDVAIVAIAEKIRLPNRIITILKGEGLLNDAAAIILFKFALAAAITHQFSPGYAVSKFIIVIIAETGYGILIGFIIGKLRLKLRQPILNMMASLLTPFFAYFPPALLGGSGVLATAVTGFVIGHRFLTNFPPVFRLVNQNVWPMIVFSIESILFLLVGLDIKSVLQNISIISITTLLMQTFGLIATIILGRFIWVFAFVYFLPRFLFASIRKNDPYPPWQFPFLVSWSGMRGSVSLAIALAIPYLPETIDGIDAKYLIIYFVFMVIVATFIIQGLTLPWIIKKLHITQFSNQEDLSEHLSELNTRLTLIKGVLRWLSQYKTTVQDNPKMVEEVKLYIRQYKMLKNELKTRISDHYDESFHDGNEEEKKESFILREIIEIERCVLLDLWQKDKITFALRNKLLDKLDHRAKVFLNDLS